MAITAENVVSTLQAAFKAAERHEQPYRHWMLKSLIPDSAIDDIIGLPFPAPALGGVSGKREVHNATRKYFDVENRAKYPVISAISDAFQDPRITRGIENPAPIAKITRTSKPRSFYFDPSSATVAIFLLVIAVLLVRPKGLLGHG